MTSSPQPCPTCAAPHEICCVAEIMQHQTHSRSPLTHEDMLGRHRSEAGFISSFFPASSPSRRRRVSRRVQRALIVNLPLFIVPRAALQASQASFLVQNHLPLTRARSARFPPREVLVVVHTGAATTVHTAPPRLGTMIPADPAVDVHDQGTEYKHAFGSKPPTMPPAGPTHGRLITDASSSYRIGLPDPGLAPAAAIPKWASPLYPQKSPDSHWAPTSTDITGVTPPASFANIFMYKSIPAANLR